MKPIALIVEDSEPISRIWRECLEELGMDVRASTSLAHAKILSRQIPPPDLIILDLRLEDSNDPKLTIESIEELKRPNPNMVLIVISGFVTTEIATLAITKGAHAVAEKMKIQTQADLWAKIQESLDKGPAKAKDALAYSTNLYAKLAKKLHPI